MNRFLARGYSLLLLPAVMMTLGFSALGAQEAPRRVIIDSDAAMGYLFRDIDDGLMLVAALGSPDIEIVGITTTFGNVGQEKATAKVMEIVGEMDRLDIPVIPGAASGGEYGSENAAAQFIADAVAANPGTITILATGSLTNIAAALATSAEVAGSILEVIAVGGLIESSDPEQLRLPYDMNFGADPQAVQDVISSGVNLTLIHIELCLHFVTTGRQFSTLLESAGNMADYLRMQTRSWRLIKAGNFVLWDVVGLNYLQHPEWYETREAGLQVIIDPGPRPSVTLRADETAQSTVRLPMTMADLDAYWRWLAEQLEQAGRSGNTVASQD